MATTRLRRAERQPTLRWRTRRSMVAGHGKSKSADAIAARNSLRDAGATVLGIVMTGDG